MFHLTCFCKRIHIKVSFSFISLLKSSSKPDSQSSTKESSSGSSKSRQQEPNADESSRNQLPVEHTARSRVLLSPTKDTRDEQSLTPASTSIAKKSASTQTTPFSPAESRPSATALVPVQEDTAFDSIDDSSSTTANQFNLFEHSNGTVDTNLKDDEPSSVEPAEKLQPKSYLNEFSFGGVSGSKFKHGCASVVSVEEDEDVAAATRDFGDGGVGGDLPIMGGPDGASAEFYPYELTDAEAHDLNVAAYGLIHSSSNPKLSSFAKRIEPILEEEETIEEEEKEEEDEEEDEAEEKEEEEYIEKFYDTTSNITRMAVIGN